MEKYQPKYDQCISGCCKRRCVHSFTEEFRVYEMRCYILHKVCSCCGQEFEYHRHRMCPSCGASADDQVFGHFA